MCLVHERLTFVYSISGECFFFFQAEDGIRDLTVTGVQTCALPISRCTGRHGAAIPRERHQRLQRASGAILGRALVKKLAPGRANQEWQAMDPCALQDRKSVV